MVRLVLLCVRMKRRHTLLFLLKSHDKTATEYTDTSYPLNVYSHVTFTCPSKFNIVCHFNGVFTLTVRFLVSDSHILSDSLGYM